MQVYGANQSLLHYVFSKYNDKLLNNTKKRQIAQNNQPTLRNNGYGY